MECPTAYSLTVTVVQCCTVLVDVVRTDGHSEVVRLLLEAGANANIFNSLLVTPLHLAALGELTTAHRGHHLQQSSAPAQLLLQSC